LCIGGVQVARGYLQRPGLTAERFVPDPFSAEAGARLYRTGDVVRRIRDGEVEYLGRADQQVKIRGFRIELGEVEAVIRQHPLVREVAAVVRGEGTEQSQLVAYVVGNESEDRERSLSELRAYVAARLPEYMTPSLFVELDHLPLTQNGKLDRRALPEPERRVEVEYVAPGNAVEEVLTDVWRTVLGLKRVGVKDNFFELGGHSLLATQIVSHVKDIFDLDVPVRSLFETPTISELAIALAEKSEDPQAIKTIARTFIELQNLSEDEVRSRLLEREKAVGAT